jgi:CHAD domain-containing protein
VTHEEVLAPPGRARRHATRQPRVRGARLQSHPVGSVARTVTTTGASHTPAVAPRLTAPASSGGARHATVLRARLVRLVREQSDGYLTAVAQARKQAARGAVHALRVATRRVRALCELVRPIDPSAHNAKLERYLTEPFRACGPLRDLHVMQRRVRALEPRFPAARAFLRALERRERKARVGVARALDAAHPRRVARMLGDVAAHLDLATADRARRERAAHLMALQLAGAGRAVEAARVRAHSGDPDSLHRLRIASKSLRYMLELAAPLGLERVPQEAERWRRVQTELGTIADHTILLRALDAYLAKHPRVGARLAGMRAGIERERKRLVGRFVAKAARSEAAAGAILDHRSRQRPQAPAPAAARADRGGAAGARARRGAARTGTVVVRRAARARR